MKCIKELVKHIRNQLKDAEQYAKQALAYKDKDPKLADMYITLSKAEVDHMNMEHDQAVRIIKEQQAKGVDIPPAMQAIWDWQHECMMEDKTEVMVLINSYK